MRRYALTAVGADRPGIAAAVTEVLYAHKCDIRDSNMMLLDDEFAIALIMTLPGRKKRSTVENDLKQLKQSENITVNLNEIPEKSAGESPASDFIATLHGKNRPGIIYRVCALLHGLGANVTNLESKALDVEGKGLYVLVVEAATPEGVPAKKVLGRLKTLAKRLGLKSNVQLLDTRPPA